MQQAHAQADDLHQQLEARQAAAEAAAEAEQEVKALKQVSMSVAYKCSRRRTHMAACNNNMFYSMFNICCSCGIQPTFQ